MNVTSLLSQDPDNNLATVRQPRCYYCFGWFVGMISMALIAMIIAIALRQSQANERTLSRQLDELRVKK